MEFADQAELDAFLVNHPDIEVIELVMPDLSGIARCKRIQRSEFRRLFSGDFLSPQAAPLLGILGDFYDNTPLPELNGDPDQLLRPISGTLAPVPWYTSPVAQLMVAYVTDSGRPDWVDTRLPLMSVLEQLEADGTIKTGDAERMMDDYREKLEIELKAIRESEMWRAGAAVRSLRPENRR